jgi:hypothetical protein
LTLKSAGSSPALALKICIEYPLYKLIKVELGRPALYLYKKIDLIYFFLIITAELKVKLID